MAWKRTIPTRLLEGEDSVLYPSYLDSWLFWREQLTTDPYINGQPNKNRYNWDRLAEFTKSPEAPEGKAYFQLRHSDVVSMFYRQKKETNHSGVCPQCGGKSIIWNTANGKRFQTWCLCALPEWLHGKMNALYPYRRTFEKASFAGFDVSQGRVDANKRPIPYPALIAAMQACKEFVKDDRKPLEPGVFPDRQWVALLGGYGTGKTRLLRAVATNLGPIAIYIRSADLKNMIMTETWDKEGDLPRLINTLAYAPYLIIDDFGAENAKEHVASVLLDILDLRYNDLQEYPTLLATNLTSAELRRNWGRLGDRLTDRAHKIIELEGVPSYRQLPVENRRRGI